MATGFTAAELIEQFREEMGAATARPLPNFTRDEQEILRRLIERTALQVVAKAIELNNARLEKDLKPAR